MGDGNGGRRGGVTIGAGTTGKQAGARCPGGNPDGHDQHLQRAPDDDRQCRAEHGGGLPDTLTLLTNMARVSMATWSILPPELSVNLPKPGVWQRDDQLGEHQRTLTTNTTATNPSYGWRRREPTAGGSTPAANSGIYGDLDTDGDGDAGKSSFGSRAARREARRL